MTVDELMEQLAELKAQGLGAVEIIDDDGDLGVWDIEIWGYPPSVTKGAEGVVYMRAERTISDDLDDRDE